MTGQPLEARCDHCTKFRPLFLYEPDHDFHATGRTCEWCNRARQPLLCTHCWSTEKQREEATPIDPEDAAAAAAIAQSVINNDHIISRRQADRDACEAIANATEENT